MIVVLTCAKVSTTSIYHALAAVFPGEVAWTHTLRLEEQAPLAAYLKVAGEEAAGLRVSVDDGTIVRAIAAARSAGAGVTLVSGVRDPIARSLSVAMQMLDELFVDCIRSTADETAAALQARITALWCEPAPADPEDPVRAMARFAVRGVVGWFERELEEPFGFDLSPGKVDLSAGHAILTVGDVRLLLFRQEDAPEAIEQGLASLFPDKQIVVARENAAHDKQSGEVYRILKARFRLPRPILDAIYAHREVTAFYSTAEIAAFVDRWALPAASAPHISPRATVAIALHNHAAWIGQQLDSLFAQWRPDLELLLIDDGSTDQGLDVVLGRLAQRPDISATILRHATSRGHAVLADVAANAQAPIIIQADSDDITLPGRIAAILQCFADDPQCRLVTSNAVMISESGIPIGIFNPDRGDTVLGIGDALPTDWGPWIGAASAFHRGLIDDFEPLDSALCPYGLDLLNPVRATLTGTHHHLSRPLIGWRQHGRNTHRVMGFSSGDPLAQERYAALDAMVYAQRVRDVAWRQACADLPQGEAMLARAHAQLLERFSVWARLRNQLTDDSRPAVRADPPGIPPIMTLVRNRVYSAEAHSTLGHAVSQWRGFFAPEDRFTWTSRQIVVAFRIPDPAVSTITVTLGSNALFPSRQALLSTDPAEGFVVADLPADGTVDVAVPIADPRDALWGGLILLSIVVPAAAAPSVFYPGHPDHRILGAALYRISVS